MQKPLPNEEKPRALSCLRYALTLIPKNSKTLVEEVDCWEVNLKLFIHAVVGTKKA